jgi:hypothetical protein
MAQIFTGNPAKVDQEVLETVRQLGDDYWVLSEFDVNGRNVDWFVIREAPDLPFQYSTMILTELKRTSAVLSGNESSPWTETRGGETEILRPRNQEDLNPYQQLINTVNAVREWMYINQRRFLTNPEQTITAAEVRIWPTLLILSSVPGTIHRLPLRPQSGFGAFHFNLQSWIASIAAWRPREGIRLSRSDLALLVAALGLQRVEEPAPAPLLPPAEFQEPVPPSPEERERPTPEPAPPATVERAEVPEWVRGMMRWAVQLETRLRRIEAHLGIEPTDETGLSRSKPPLLTRDDLTLTEEERRLLLQAAEYLATRGKPFADFPSLFGVMHRLDGGVPFKQRNFNGYGSARAMIDEAVREGLFEYGPLDPNGLPTVTLVRRASATPPSGYGGR